MQGHDNRLFRTVFLSALLLALPILAGEPVTPPVKDPAPAAAPKANVFKLPDGDSGRGWDAFLKNDFDGAEKIFRDVIAKDKKDLAALEGLRAICISRGNYKESQAVNLQMVEATAEPALVDIFTLRTMEAMNYTESRAAVLDCFIKTAAQRDGAALAILRDNIASLHLRSDRTDDAQKALEGLGYIDRWQFVAGPFGSKDRNGPFERRYAPERALKSLEFADELGRPVKVVKNVPAPHRAVSLGNHFPGANGIFYAFVNLESDSEQDVVIGFSGSSPSMVYLRGQPVIQTPDDEQFPRPVALIRTHLIKGNNPVLVKLSSAFGFTMRVLAPGQVPLKDVRIKELPADELAKHEVSTVRGIVMAKRVQGLAADYFSQRVAPEDRTRSRWLKALLDSGQLRVSEAAWVEQATQREGELRSRLALGRAIATSAGESVGALDLAAYLIQTSGRAMGDSDARESEEAKRLREHALTLLPTSHQHLLAMYYFYNEHELNDQAFEKIKACVEAHPDSPLAQAELAGVNQTKNFIVEAEQGFEKAASLDEVYLGRLVSFHDSNGSKVRARELRKKMVALGQVDPDWQLEQALSEGDLARAEELLTFLEKAYPDRTDDLSRRRVSLLNDKGDVQGAYNLQKKLYDAMPKSDDATRRPALMSLIELSLRLNKDDEAKALIKEYLAKNANDYELRHRLQGLENPTASAQWWDPYDVKVSEIDTSHFTAERYKTSNHAWIVDFMVTKIMPDLSQESYVHIAQKVLNVKGINELSEVLVRAQRNQIVFIRTLNPDGSSFMPQNVHNFNLAQTASAYKVGPGSILEHGYLEHKEADKDEPSLQEGFNFNAIDAPRAVSRWTVLIANEALPKITIRRIKPEMVEEKILPGPPGFTVYQWTNKQVEGLKFEPLMPVEADLEAIPVVHLETADQPYRGAGWLSRRERDFLPPEAEEEARKVVANIDPNDEARRFDAIVDYVRKTIQPGQDSRTLDDVWFSKQGNAGQLTTIVREMAQVVGLRCRTALINQSYSPGRGWKSKNAKRQWEPSELANFSAGFVLTQELNNGANRWVQFVGQAPKFYDPHKLNFGQPGSIAITYGEDGARLMRVAGEDFGATPTSHRMEVALERDGSSKIKGTLQFFGNLGGSVREGLSDPRRATQIKEWVVHNWWPKIQKPDVIMQNEKDPSAPMVFFYSGAIKGMAAAEADGHFVLPAFLNRPRILDLRGPQERTQDMLIRSEVADFDHTLTYTAPEGYGWLEVPDDLFIATEFGVFLSDYNVRGRTLTCTRSFFMPQQRIVPEKYPLLLDFLNAINKDQQQRIGYGPLKNESFGGVAEPVYSGGYVGIGEEPKKAPEKKADEVKVEAAK